MHTVCYFWFLKLKVELHSTEQARIGHLCAMQHMKRVTNHQLLKHSYVLCTFLDFGHPNIGWSLTKDNTVLSATYMLECWCSLKLSKKLIRNYISAGIMPSIPITRLNILLTFGLIIVLIILNYFLYLLTILTVADVAEGLKVLACSFLSFYRYVLEPDVTFLANETVSPGPVARFMELPESPLLTLNMITPESWMVQAVSSPYDLDNIHLQEVQNNSPINTQSLGLWGSL